MTQVAGIDEVLSAAIDRGDVPGVVAMATTRDSVIYQGAFGRRTVPDSPALNTDTARYMEANGVPGIISCQNAALALPLVFDPGEKWDYGINIDWVGKAVERVSRKSLGDYFDEHLFGPIGMRDT